MADVFVIAILMAFIGFGGLIDSELAQLQPKRAEVSEDKKTPDNPPSSTLTVLPSENSTSFQPGLYLFAGFCVASLLVGGLIEKRPLNAHPNHEPPSSW